MDALSTQKYQTFKRDVLEKPIVRHELSLRDLKIADTDTVEIRGNMIGMTPHAYGDLLKHLSVTPSLVRKFQRSGGANQATAFLNAIRSVLAGSDKTVVAVADGDRKKITHFLSPNQTVVSNEMFFDLFEKIMEKYTGLEVREFCYSMTNGVSVSTVNNEWQFDVPGLTDEFFKSGINFNNGLATGLTVNPYNERLACTNGMIFNRESKSYYLKKLERAAMQSFLSEVFEPSRFRFYEEIFIQRVRRMHHTECSFAELQNAYLTVRNLMYNAPNPDMLLNPEIPMHDVIADYKLHGIDINRLDINFKRNARTPVKVWDLVNALTYHASHQDTSLNLHNHDRYTLQVYAGMLAMKKTYDTETLLPDIYANPN